MAIGRCLGRLVLLGTLASGYVAAGGLSNGLQGHPSPYLAMHADDPVAWQDWGEPAIAHARETDRLLFVSSGYFACHWCHVMQRESYKNPEIATLINRNFVPVKLDRELHSALDSFLIDFVDRTTGQAGWPLNVFLTPEGYPLIGVTYLPPDRFAEMLVRTDRAWADQRGRLRDLARRTSRQLRLAGAGADKPVPALSPDALRDALLDQTLQLANPMEGGFGDQSRFPMVPQLLALLDLYPDKPDPDLDEFLRLTLDAMAGQGLRDHLGGGFFRYTVDPGWQTPHFEKMLYTQALLAEVFMRAADVFGRQDYADVARDTLTFVAREMPGAQGGYVASFSAIDGAGEEGGFYLWSVEQLQAVLDESDTALARRHWAMLGRSPFDLGHLPRRGEPASETAAALRTDPGALRSRLSQIRSRLLTARATRELPVDRKELAGWNGLLLAAFSRAAVRWNDPTFGKAAQRIADFLHNRLWRGGVLYRAVSIDADGTVNPLGTASLADYAYAAYGMEAYARLSGDPSDQTFATVLQNLAWQRFHGPGGWRSEQRPLIPAMVEEPVIAEGALPAPSAILIRLSRQSAVSSLVQRAAAAAEQGRAKVQAEPFWYAGHLSALLEGSANEDRAANSVR
ncbi:MAG: DUF255 domain-containing protein [Chromatiaceae bacterium]